MVRNCLKSRNSLLVFVLLVLGTISSQAQALLQEGFEDIEFPPTGWSVINSQAELATKHWVRITSESGCIAGKAEAYIESIYSELTEKEEWLITPEVTLPADETYSFQFKWNGQRNGVDKGYYDMQVKASTDGGESWTTLWGLKDDEKMEKSGVSCPWKQWTTYTSDVLLDSYKGQKVKLAFYYRSVPVNGYCNGRMSVDEVKIDKFTSVAAPEVEGTTSYKFENVYIGVSKADRLTLRNIGGGILNITNISGLEGTDFSTTLSQMDIALKRGEEATYTVEYHPTETGSKNATLKIETNGGTLNVELSGTKVMLPEGYTLESFEEGTMPPVGWTNSGWKISDRVGMSGSHSAVNSILTKCYLTSPRLDLSEGTHKVTFDYLEEFMDETGSTVPENNFLLEIKVDDGEWQEIWYCNEMTFMEVIRKVIDLSAYHSNNCYLRWVYDIDPSGGFETIASDIYLDDVVLPPLYKSGTLQAAKNPQPQDGATDCDYTGMDLSWEGVLYAEGYKLYIGTERDNPISVVDGEELIATVYHIPALQPSTVYYWKVVPFNENTSCQEAPVWSFTTMADQTITSFPYIMDFEGELFPALGWKLLGDGKKWSKNEISPYNGNYSCSVFQSENNKESILQSPLIVLPEGENLVASFWWAKEMPVALEKEHSSNVSQTSVKASTGNDTLYFEVKTTEEDWKILAKTLEERYWKQEIVSLASYAGKQIWLRWRYVAEDGYKAKAGAIDDIYVGEERGAGLRAVSEKTLRVYPTMVTDIIYIQGGEGANIALCDLAGRPVWQAANTDKIEVSHLPKGIYILNISKEGRIHTIRIVKN